MTVQENFDKDRAVEREVKAINNYFKLFLLSERIYSYDGNLECSDKDAFELLGGKELLSELVNDINEGVIELTVPNYGIRKYLGDLTEKVEYLEKVTSTKSTTTLKLIENAKYIQNVFKKYDEEDFLINLFYELLMVLPTEEKNQTMHDVTVPFVKEKKLGER